MMVMLAGTIRRVDMCQPAWSTKRMAWAAGATVAAISARCRLIASVLLVTRCDGAGAALGVILFFWPMQNFQVRSLDFNFDQIRASVL